MLGKGDEPAARDLNDEPLTCVVADDHPALVRAVAEFLTHHGMTVVGQAGDGHEALRVIRAARPRVAIVDLQMPGLNGIEIARAVRETALETSVLLYTGFDDRQLLLDALDAGVRGFALKGAPLGELVEAVRFVARGDVYVDATLAPVIVSAGVAGGGPKLSKRERQTLQLLAEGMSLDAIGAALFISPHTVRTHLKQAMLKLEADTRTQAVAIAIRQSLI